MPKSNHSRWWLAAEASLALALILTPWSFGGAPWWALWLVVGLGGTSLLLWTVGGARNHRRWGFHPALLLPLVAAGASLIQLIPLPPALLALLSPPAAELREFALAPLGIEGWRQISLDPPSTARALARYLGLGSMLFVALELGKMPQVRHRLFSVQTLAGVSIALTGLGHLLAGADSLFGLHHFIAALGLQTPFGNTNHLAAYLGLSATVALGQALGKQSKDAAIGWLAAAFLCGVTVFLSFSRGGIATFVATWALAGAAMLARRGGGLRAVVPWVVIGATVLSAGLLAFEQLADRIDTVSSIEKLRRTKVELWPMLAEGELHTWPLGMGAGAFEHGFTRWQTEQLDVSFTHPENIWFQALADWGLPLTVGLFVFAAWLLRRAWLGLSALTTERVVLIALVGLLLHDVFDFSLELQAAAVAASILLGLVLGSAVAPTEPRRRAGWAGVMCALAVTVAAVVALWFGLPTHESTELRLATALRQGRPVDEVRALAKEAIVRHPADWVLYANVAADFSRRADPREALAWVNRLLFLRPNDAHAHVAAANALLRLGQPLQALGELKSGWVLGDRSTLDLGLAVAVKHDALDRVLLDREGHLTTLWEVLRRRGQNDEALRLLNAVEVSAVAEAVHDEAAVLRVRQEAELGDPARALKAWEGLPEAERGKAPQQVVRVALLERLGRGDEALAAMERLVAKAPGQLDLTLRLVDMLAARERPAAAREVLERSRPFFVGPQQRSLVFQREAALLVKEERWSRALEALETAARLEPTRAELRYQMAAVLERMGILHSALEELRKGRLLDTPQGAKAQDPIAARLEAAVAAGQ